jgi:hypothetical protein
MEGFRAGGEGLAVYLMCESDGCGTALGERAMRRETFPVFLVRTMTQRAELGVFGQKERVRGRAGRKVVQEAGIWCCWCSAFGSARVQLDMCWMFCSYRGDVVCHSTYIDPLCSFSLRGVLRDFCVKVIR